MSSSSVRTAGPFLGAVKAIPAAGAAVRHTHVQSTLLSTLPQALRNGWARRRGGSRLGLRCARPRPRAQTMSVGPRTLHPPPSFSAPWSKAAWTRNEGGSRRVGPVMKKGLAIAAFALWLGAFWGWMDDDSKAMDRGNVPFWLLGLWRRRFWARHSRGRTQHPDGRDGRS